MAFKVVAHEDSDDEEEEDSDLEVGEGEGWRKEGEGSAVPPSIKGSERSSPSVPISGDVDDPLVGAPPILLLGSAAFESKAFAVERQQSQVSHSHSSPTAFPAFIKHQLNIHRPHSLEQQHHRLHHTPTGPTDAPSSIAVSAGSTPTVSAATSTGVGAGPVSVGSSVVSMVSAASLASVVAGVSASPLTAPSPSPSPHSTGAPAVSGRVTEKCPAVASSASPALQSKALVTVVQLCCEVLSSEVTYVSRLDDFLLRYVSPLKVRHAQLGVAREDVDVLFSYIEPIVGLHHQLLDHWIAEGVGVAVEQLSLSLTSSPLSIDVLSLDRCVGALSSTLLSYLPYLKMYVQYVNSYNQAMEALKRLSEGKKFLAFLAQTHKHPILDLPSYLIMPIQRYTNTHQHETTHPLTHTGRRCPC